MINVIIIEDEQAAMNQICSLLTESSNEIHIQSRFRSVKESLDYFQHATLMPDIIFSDVQLPDGLSFEIFRQADLRVPVIFTTCYDQFMLMAFENNGIDYLLKPLEKKDVEKALLKYKGLKNYFVQQERSNPYSNLVRMMNQKERSRIIVKRGIENIVLKLEDIVLFFTENKISFVIDKFSHKYLLDRSLTDLEQELDKNIFFRANRRYIINLNFVRGFKPFEKVKLLLDLDLKDRAHSIVVSQETAPSFRKWMREA